MSESLNQSSGSPARSLSGKVLDRRLIWLALACANALALWFQWSSGGWLISENGSVYQHDYLAQWAAGFRVLSGQAHLVYDWAAHTELQARLIGAPKPVEYYVFYPPHFLFTTIAFTWLGPVAAYLAFLATTVCLYALALRLITRDMPKALFAALAGGGAYISLLWVQNGFLTAALLTSGLLLLPSKPRLAGILIGILSIKPQLGVLIPFALAAAGYWRSIGWAAGTFLGLAIAAELILGPGIWVQFIQSMFQTTEFLEAGSLWFKMQTPFTLVWPILGNSGAYLVQAVVALVVGWIVVRLWRDSSTPHGLKSAALIAGSLLMSPYLYAYDAVALTAAALLIIRENPRLPLMEGAALVFACVLPGLTAYLYSACVPFAALIMLVLAVRSTERLRDLATSEAER